MSNSIDRLLAYQIRRATPGAVVHVERAGRFYAPRAGRLVTRKRRTEHDGALSAWPR